MRSHRPVGAIIAVGCLVLAGLTALGGVIDLFAKPPKTSSKPVALSNAADLKQGFNNLGIFAWSPPSPIPTPLPPPPPDPPSVEPPSADDIGPFDVAPPRDPAQRHLR